MGLLVLPYGVQGCKYMCGGLLEDLRIPFWPFLFCFSVISWNHLVSFLHVIKLCLLSQNSKFPSFFFFPFSCLNHFSPVLCPISSSVVGGIIISIWDLPTQPSSEGWRVPSRRIKSGFPEVLGTSSYSSQKIQ